MSPSAHSSKKGRVLIIGAGFAGLSCAFELKRDGYDVLVFEAKDRVGGRVWSRQDVFPGAIVEAGGEFVGANHPAWLDYADQFSILLEPFADAREAPRIYLRGREVTGAALLRYWKGVEWGRRYLADAAGSIVEDQPWLSPEADMLDHCTLEDLILGMPISGEARDGLRTEFMHNMGADPSALSALGILTVIKGHGCEAYWTDTERFTCPTGTHSLAVSFVKAIGCENVKLNMPVAIVCHDDSACAVECAGGEKWDGNWIVLAVPPSKWTNIVFKKRIPFIRLKMGLNIKYFSENTPNFSLESFMTAPSVSDDVPGQTCIVRKSSSAGLSSFTGGPPAARVLREPHRILQRYRSDLDDLIPGFEEHLKRDFLTTWSSDPWIQAGYACPAPGQITRYGQVLRQGFGRLRIAGEHTCFKFMGFMEGALQSGKDTAGFIKKADHRAG